MELELFKQEFEEKIIKEFFNYLSDGTHPKSYENSMTVFYNKINNLADMGLGLEILEYHNEKIKQASNECHEKIKNLEGSEFINAFIIYTERLNYFILHMSSIFAYISNNYLKPIEQKNNKEMYEEEDISEFSMKIYKSSFFDKLRIKLFEILNKEIIRNMQDKTQIESIMKILFYLDLIKPKISKSGKASIIWIETFKGQKDKQFSYKNEWLSYFKDGIKNKYLKDFENKIERAIQDNSLKEKIHNEIINIKNELDNLINNINTFPEIDINYIFYERIIKKYIEPILNIKDLLDNKKINEFTELYLLFCIHPDGRMLITEKTSEYIKEKKADFFNNEKSTKESKEFIPELLDIKKEIDELFSSRNELKNL